MRKLIIGCMLVLLLGISAANAGVTFYEKGDLRVNVNDMTACMLYDVKQGDMLAGMKTSIVEYQKWNLDVGFIGKYNSLDDLDIFVGASYDIKALNYKDVLYSNVGIFASPGWIDKGQIRYGAYGGVKISF